MVSLAVDPRLYGLFESPSFALTFDDAEPIGAAQWTPQYRRNSQAETVSSSRPADAHGEEGWVAFVLQLLGTACLAVLGASLMKKQAKKDTVDINNNPAFSTPTARAGSDRDKRSYSAPASMTVDDRLRRTYSKSQKPRQAAELEMDITDPDGACERSHHSPTSAMELDDATLRASPVEQLEQEGQSPTSPTTRASSPTLPREQPCFAAPRRTSSSRVLLANAANLMRDVYVHLVRNRVFIGNDVLEHYEPLDCASLDPMGVLFSAQTMMRVALTQELLAEHNLDMQIRELMASILLIVYKMRSESAFRQQYYDSHSAMTVVMSQFMQPSELPLRQLDAVREHLTHLELEMMTKLPLFALVDETPHAAMEWALHQHFDQQLKTHLQPHQAGLACGELEARCAQRDLQKLHKRELMLALSAGYFFYHAACLRTEDEMLETMAQWCTAAEMGEALAFLCVKAMSFVPGSMALAPPDASATVAKAAAYFVRNANVLSASRTPGLRVAAYAQETHPCQQIVGARALGRLHSALKSFL
jgi:hypothetical protein